MSSMYSHISFQGASTQTYIQQDAAAKAKFQERFSSIPHGQPAIDDSVEISTKAREASAKIATLKGIVSEENQIYKVYESQSGETRKELLSVVLPGFENLNVENGESTFSNDEIGLFSGSANPYTNLGKMLGLKGMFSDKSSFLTGISNLISQESKSLTSDLRDILKKAGLEDVTKKITFAEDTKVLVLSSQ